MTISIRVNPHVKIILILSHPNIIQILLHKQDSNYPIKNEN